MTTQLTLIVVFRNRAAQNGCCRLECCLVARLVSNWVNDSAGFTNVGLVRHKLGALTPISFSVTFCLAMSFYGCCWPCNEVHTTYCSVWALFHGLGLVLDCTAQQRWTVMQEKYPEPERNTFQDVEPPNFVATLFTGTVWTLLNLVQSLTLRCCLSLLLLLPLKLRPYGAIEIPLLLLLLL